MVLTPDNSTISRLVGDNTPENITLAPGQLASFPGGVWMLGGNDTVRGSSDGELIFGNDGKDSLLGGAGNDSIYGGKDDDDVLGESGNDFLTGDKNSDFVDGGAGNDLLRGGQGVDLLVGGDGNDTLIGDRDVDIYQGGAGSDVFVFRVDRAGSRILGIEVPDAVIVDFDKSSDSIGISVPFTSSNISFEQVSYSLNDPRLLLIDPGTVAGGTSLLAKGGISQQSLDPDGNGRVEATNIRFGFTNALLGTVLNVTPADLNGRFINASSLL
ncbi:calcium-binding protein [Tychonema sp. LEGE 07203]|uniref:calcium-binding protein n=1 Tax=Tychonema sp. LEGE 07203 TaxID=1828671 RepID=UPI0018819DB2|nr:calcium-binding protein [Tychonema sp. LEGE 07203]MBE9094375.1 calcium-binding protein [Tychonema sp. LEGE 07203]